MKKTKIICTIGDKINNIIKLSKLLKKGMNVVRINLSHNEINDNLNKINNILLANKYTKIPVSILLDTKGPEIRTLKTKNNKPIFLQKGQKYIFTINKNIIGNNKIISIDYDNFINLININDIFFVDDGLISFKVININYKKKIITCNVLNKGYIGQKKGINIPNIITDLPILTNEDKINIINSVKITNIDFIALSFVRNLKDILDVKNFIISLKLKYNPKIIAKIENNIAIKNLDEIINNVDGIMIARGDLGVELPLEKIVMLQKNIIIKCKNKAKIVIIATQMLESMINNNRPTRAEVTDIANAILDGTDAIMLSAETAIGNYPILTVKTMSKICNEIDFNNDFNYFTNYKKNNNINKNILEEVCSNLINFSNNKHFKLLILITNNINKYYFIKKNNHNNMIIFITNNKNIINLSMLSRGIYSYNFYKNIKKCNKKELYNYINFIIKNNNFLKNKDNYLLFIKHKIILKKYKI